MNDSFIKSTLISQAPMLAINPRGWALQLESTLGLHRGVKVHTHPRTDGTAEQGLTF